MSRLPKSFATFVCLSGLIFFSVPGLSIAQTVKLPLCDIALYGNCADISIADFNWLVANNASYISVKDGSSYIYNSDEELIKIYDAKLVQPGRNLTLIKEKTRLHLTAI